MISTLYFVIESIKVETPPVLAQYELSQKTYDIHKKYHDYTSSDRTWLKVDSHLEKSCQLIAHSY